MKCRGERASGKSSLWLPAEWNFTTTITQRHFELLSRHRSSRKTRPLPVPEHAHKTSGKAPLASYALHYSCANSFSPILTSEGRLEKKEQPLSLLENEQKWQRWGEEQSHSTEDLWVKSGVILHPTPGRKDTHYSRNLGEKSQINASSFYFKDGTHPSLSRANGNCFYFLWWDDGHISPQGKRFLSEQPRLAQRCH